MSFELTLGSALDEAAFDALVAGRPHYQPGEDQAAYQNEDTGVYFLLGREADGVHFSINICRPDVFAEEAAEELAALFGDAFNADTFLADWRAANARAIAAMLAEGREPLTLPLRTNREVWRWNRSLAVRQAEIEGEGIAPPLIYLLGADGTPCPSYIWLMSKATAKPPPAEAVVLADDPAPRLRDKLLGATPQLQTIGMIQIRWLRDLGFPVWRSSLDMLVFHVPQAERNSPSILATMASAHAYAKPVGTRVRTDQVLDREAVDAARAGLAG